MFGFRHETNFEIAPATSKILLSKKVSYIWSLLNTFEEEKAGVEKIQA